MYNDQDNKNNQIRHRNNEYTKIITIINIRYFKTTTDIYSDSHLIEDKKF